MGSVRVIMWDGAGKKLKLGERYSWTAAIMDVLRLTRGDVLPIYGKVHLSMRPVCWAVF